MTAVRMEWNGGKGVDRAYEHVDPHLQHGISLHLAVGCARIADPDNDILPKNRVSYPFDLHIPGNGSMMNKSTLNGP